MIKTEERSDLEKQNSNFNSYRKEVLEVLENLKTLKQKKLKESEVEDYLKFVKNNMRFNIDSYIGYDSRALKKDSFIKAFEGLTLESLDKIKIKLKSMAIELNFQKGYPVLFSKQTPNPRNDYGLRSNAITTFTGRLIEKPKLASFDYRIERIREIQNFLGLELFEWNFAYEN